MDMATGNLDERYLSAGNSHDLSVRPGQDGPVEALVSVAWSRGRLGGALLRLHSEFDGAARRGLKPEQAFLQLKSLPEVRDSLMAWAVDRKPDRGEVLTDPEILVAAVLAWWLDKRCSTCLGTGWVTRAAQPKKPCSHCHGTREARLPHGNEGRALEAYMNACMHRHRASIKGRMARR